MTSGILSKEHLAKIADRREKSNLLTSLAANNSMQRNLQREDQLLWEHQKALHKAEHGEAMDDEETINNTFDSPVTHNHYHGDDKKPSAIKTALPLIAALTLGPAAGAAAGYLMSNTNTPSQQDDETVRIGLGRIEDLISE